MVDYLGVLKENPNGVLATQDGKNVQTRVFQYLFSDGDKAFFCTSSEKPVYTQLLENPSVSFCTYSSAYSPVLSLNGDAFFVDDLALKTRALDENPGIKSIYISAENPVFKIFYIEIKEVVLFDFETGTKRYAL